MTRNSCLTNVSGTCFTPEQCCYVLPCLSTQSPAQNTCQALTPLWVHSWGSQAPQGAWGCPPSLVPMWHSATACDPGGTGDDMEQPKGNHTAASQPAWATKTPALHPLT